MTGEMLLPLPLFMVIVFMFGKTSAHAHGVLAQKTLVSLARLYPLATFFNSNRAPRAAGELLRQGPSSRK